MDNYSINAVEQLTGVKAHTLRIWEKRYEGLLPHRTATNIRYYDDDQLRKLLNISTLLHHGYKISKVMKMTEEDINEQITSLSQRPNTEDIFEVHINALVDHMLVFDEPGFDKTCSNVIIRYGLYEAMIKVIYPFLRKTGVLWTTTNATPSQEHFASNIIERKLLSAIDGIPFPKMPKKKFLVFLPPYEWHQIGLLLTDFLIRNSGAASIYLGQNVPFDSLRTALAKTKATHLVTAFTSGINIEEHLKKISDIASENDKAIVLAHTRTPIDLKLKNIIMLQSTEDLLRHL